MTLDYVSIVGYLGFTEKARQSNDNTLISEINNVLLADATSDGKPETMSEVMDRLEKRGFLIENLTPTSDKNEFVWDQNANKFSIVKEQDLLSGNADPNLWIIVDNEERLNDVTAKYSVFLSSKFIEDGDKELTVTNGFDAGNFKGLKKLNLRNQTNSTMTLNTNDGNILVNAPEATINHRGITSTVNIEAVAENSYHEYGQAENIQIAKGRVEITEKAQVKSVVIKVAAPTKDKPEVTKPNVIVEVKDTIAEDKKPSVSIAVPTVSEEAGFTKEEVETLNNAINGIVSDVKKDVVAKNPTIENKVVEATSVATFEEFDAALRAKKPNIVLTADIEYGIHQDKDLLNVFDSTEINGQGHTLSGYGVRPGNSSQKPTLTIQMSGMSIPQAKNKVDVVIRNLNLVSDVTNARVIETRGNVNSLALDNVDIKATGPKNNQGLTIGGSQTSKVKVDIKNSSISVGDSGYCYISFNPAILSIDNCDFTGWAGLYFKGVVGSTGSIGSEVSVKNSRFICNNTHKGETNSFGVFVFEDGGIILTIEDSYIQGIKTKPENENQYLVLFSEWADDIKNRGGVTVLINGDSTIISGENQLSEKNDNIWDTPGSNKSELIIEGGRFNCDPSKYLPEGYEAVLDGMTYKVQKK